MAAMAEILEEMGEILKSEGRLDFADMVGKIAAETDSNDFVAQIASLDVWGGSGSLVDVTLEGPIAERRFNELIVDLAEALDQLGFGTPRTRWVAQTIEDWLIANPKMN